MLMILSVAAVPAAAAATENANSDILNHIEFDKTSLEFNDILDNFETVTTNPTAFLNDVSDGQVTLKLLGQEFDLDLHETNIVSDDAVIITENGSWIPAPKIFTYRGTVVGKANSSVLLTVADDVIIGGIEVEDKSYFVEQTSLKHEGKVVHVVYSSDAFKAIEYLEYNSDGDDTEEVQEDLPTSSLNQTQISAISLRPISIVDMFKKIYQLAGIQTALASVNSLISKIENDTLSFFIYNSGNTNHEVTVEVFDSKNISVFNESYILAPGERSKFPITWASGPYMYKVTLDNNTTKTEIVSEDFDMATLYIDIDMYSNDPLILGIAVP